MTMISPEAIESYRQNSRIYSFDLSASNTITYTSSFIVFSLSASGVAADSTVEFIDADGQILDMYIVPSTSADSPGITFTGIFPVYTIKSNVSSGTINIRMTPLPTWNRTNINSQY